MIDPFDGQPETRPDRLNDERERGFGRGRKKVFTVKKWEFDLEDVWKALKKLFKKGDT